MNTDSLQNAIVCLLRDRPFYGHVLLNMRRCVMNDISRSTAVTIRSAARHATATTGMLRSKGADVMARSSLKRPTISAATCCCGCGSD